MTDFLRCRYSWASSRSWLCTSLRLAGGSQSKTLDQLQKRSCGVSAYACCMSEGSCSQHCKSGKPKALSNSEGVPSSPVPLQCRTSRQFIPCRLAGLSCCACLCGTRSAGPHRCWLGRRRSSTRSAFSAHTSAGARSSSRQFSSHIAQGKVACMPIAGRTTLCCLIRCNSSPLLLGRILAFVVAARSRDLHRSLKSAAWLPVVTSGRCTTSAHACLHAWLALPSMQWRLWPLLM